MPLAFLSGVTGEFYRQFAVTIAASVLISGLNSLTLSPAISAILLKPRGAPNGRIGNFIDAIFGWIFRPFNRVFARGSSAYSRGVGVKVVRCGRMVAIYYVLLVVDVICFRDVPGGF